MRVAFYGRSADGDTRERGHQSLANQYLACQRTLPADARLTAVYYDLGTAARPRPHPPSHLTVAGKRLPRDGGLADLLTHASSPPSTRRFDHVIITETSRLTRDAGESLKVFQRLADLGVALLLAGRSGSPHVVRLDQPTIDLLTHLHRSVHDHLATPSRVEGPATTRPAPDPRRGKPARRDVPQADQQPLPEEPPPHRAEP